MSVWTINNQSPESLGVTVAAFQFNSGRASTVQLACSQNFDAAERFFYNQSVTVQRDSQPFFTGRVRAIPKSGDPSSEGHDYQIEDVWAELERLTYQEPWLIRDPSYTGPIYSPTVILGLNSAGNKISVGQQISEVLQFASSQGVNLSVGSVPSGMMLWPSEVVGQTCAALIRDCLKYYPDWIPWINHTYSPPQFNVTPRTSAQQVYLPITDCTSVQVTRVNDRVPAGVRIVYTAANVVENISGESSVYRQVAIDQAPSASVSARVAPAGPGVLVTTVELQGMQVQIQKQQVQVQSLPVTTAGAITYLKSKFPTLKDVPNNAYTIQSWTTTVVPDDLTDAQAIDSKLPRVAGNVRSQLPNELVKGCITEWMQRKVGRVLVEFSIKAEAEASEADQSKIRALPTWFTVVCTNAVTKIYQGVSSYTGPEAVPQGIAAAYYQTLLNGCDYEGSITLHGEEVSQQPFHGSSINLTGSSAAGWSNMAAPIHSVSYDLASGETRVAFGPNPDYSIQDFMEFLKLLNKRPFSQYTQQERAGDQHGSTNSTSARGDSIGAYDTPAFVAGPGPAAKSTPQPFELVASGTPGDNQLILRESTIANQTVPGFTNGRLPFTIDDRNGVIYAKITVSQSQGNVTNVEVGKAATLPANTNSVYYTTIGSYTVEGNGGNAVIIASNYQFGPIRVDICRNWYATATPYYRVVF